MKRDKLDAIFSNMVRERVNWTCETCKKYYPEGHRQGLHCSHVFGRRAVATRWHPENAIAQCYHCHKMGEEDRKGFVEWVSKEMGRGRYERLRQIWHKPVKWSKKLREEIYRDYKKKYQVMEDERNGGFLGRIEFERHEVMAAI